MTAEKITVKATRTSNKHAPGYWLNYNLGCHHSLSSFEGNAGLTPAVKFLECLTRESPKIGANALKFFSKYMRPYYLK